MNAAKVVGIVLIVLGFLGAAYGGFSYIKDTHQANIGSLSFKLTEKQHVNIPPWASLVSIVVGGVLLATSSRKT
ncbi:MAG TPA: hypothetical protein VIE69_09105 [Methylophilaceae bacterium]|jgi:TRAP-type C4-dicarboxylate transport system permease small subunit